MLQKYHKTAINKKEKFKKLRPKKPVGLL